MGSTEFKTPVSEGSSRVYRAQITSPDGPVTLEVIVSIKFTLVDVATGEVINGRNEQDVKNANGGSLTDDGWFVLVLGPDDMVATNGTRFQKRRGLFEVEYTDGHENHVITWAVENLANV